MIHILHHQNDEIVGWINSVYDDKHIQALKNNEETYNFIVPATERDVSKLTSRARLVIPSEDGDFREFVIDYTQDRTSSMRKEVYSYGSFIDLRKLKVIEPQVLEGQSISTAAGMVLEGLPWQLGLVDYSTIRKWEIEEHTDAYSALKDIASLFEMELRFRVTVSGDNITGRYVDFITKQGLNRGKEIVFGKDLVDITRRVLSDRLVTALHCVGPEREDGTRLEVTVTDDAAYQNWNWQGNHLIQVYTPEFTDQDMTLSRLTQLGEAELQKRVTAAIEYEIEAVSLEHIFGFEHEKVRIGDSARVKDEHFNPPIYLDSRIVNVERSIFDKTKKVFKLGEVIEYSQEDIMKTWRELQSLYGTRIIKSPTPPPGRPNTIWVKTGGDSEIAHTWDILLNKWIPLSGSYTWVMYADDENGLNMSEDPTDKNYIGLAYNQTVSSPSSNPQDYSWSLFRGPQGVPGTTGDDGQPTYTWIKYADDINGTNMSDSPTGKKYIGLAHNKTSIIESNIASDYTWALFQGPKGADGYTPVKGTDYFDGKDGQDGKSSYLWVRYSQNSNGNPMTTDPTGAKYIGIATTQTTTAPTSYSSYTWSLVKGTDGVPGEDGANGQTSYLHIKYSNDGGATFTANNGETVGEWIGTYVDFTAADSNSVASYTWNKVKGDKGDPGYTPVKGTDYFDGKDGQDGKSSYLWVRYSQASNGNPMTTDPTNAKYIGVATTQTATAPTSYSSYTWSLIKGTDGVPGEDGANGQTSYLHIKYSNDGGSTFTANNGETVGEWIGTYVDFTAADSNSVSSYTWNKVKGDKGDPGKGISSITEYYLASASSSGVTTATAGWSTAIQTISSSKKYLWNYEKVTYTDGTSTNTTPVIIGTYGDVGDAGKGISSIVEYYLASSSSSGVTTSTAGWSTTIQTTTTTNKYLWNYEKITYTDGSITTTSPVIIGTHGATGSKGDPGPEGPQGPQGQPGFKLNWNTTGTVTVDSQGRIYKKSGATAWDTGAYSSEGYSGGAFLTFKVGMTNQNLMIGLNTDPATDSGYSSIDYAFYIRATGVFSFYESGASKTPAEGTPAYAPGDVFSISYDNEKIEYYHNGRLIRSLQVTGGLNLYVDMSIATASSVNDPQIYDIYFSPLGAKGDKGDKGEPGTNGTNGKDGIAHMGTTAPSNPATNATWFKQDSTGKIIGIYKWTGSAWVEYQMTQDVLNVTNLAAINANLGNITAGKLTGVQILVSGTEGTVDIQNDYIRSIRTDSKEAVDIKNGQIQVLSGGTDWITATKKLQMHTGGIWLLDSASDDISLTTEGLRTARTYIAPTLLNGVTNYGSVYETAGYLKDALGNVRLKGFLTGSADGKHLFTLPTGYRPSKLRTYTCWSNSSVGSGRITVDTDGRVLATISGNWISLDNVYVDL